MMCDNREANPRIQDFQSESNGKFMRVLLEL